MFFIEVFIKLMENSMVLDDFDNFKPTHLKSKLFWRAKLIDDLLRKMFLTA